MTKKELMELLTNVPDDAIIKIAAVKTWYPATLEIRECVEVDIDYYSESNVVEIDPNF